ncbi:chromate transporter [Streptobacillus felis]|uniref:Chromate transporter n=1 Tax=Streptobacillus felis TaxID=1384509 RepID=A0A7Z0PHD4_9FUSO|nr:chromate transporter [Streptobacillus felis]NYV28275.1 chromate transporter [Streptobacillus felis]
MEKKIGYLELFTSLFIINTITFGGGYTIIPIIKDEFVNKHKAINEDEMLKIVTLAQSIPGVMTISTSFLVGQYTLGFLGAIIAVIASVLPCIIAILLIAFSYNKLIDNVYVQKVLKGISGAIIAMLFFTVYNMFVKQFENEKKYFYLSINILVLLLSLIFKLKLSYILIICSILGLYKK